MMKKVLFIAYYFPPMGGSGVQRSLKFVKYLREYNYAPIVLTVDSRFTRWPKDKSYLKEIPDDVVVYRTPTIDLNWLYKVLWGLRLNKVVDWLQLHWLVPDSEITWLPFARLAIAKILKKHKIDIAYITGGPYSSMLLGPYLSANHGFKYVVDFRDEWTNNHTRLDRAYSLKARARDNALERKVLEHCMGVIYTHPKYMQDNFENKYPFLKNKLSAIITNGFDETDFSGDLVNTTSTEVFRIVYSGSFYDRRRPGVLLQAIYNLLKTGKIKPNDILLEIYGKNTPGFVLGEFSDVSEIKALVKFHPYLAHKQALSVIHHASALLLYLSPGANSEPELPGKMFEYMRSYKPIIAIVPARGTAADLIRESGTGFVFDSGSLEEVTYGIMNIITSWKQGNFIIQPDKKYISQFNRRNLTSKLADLFDEVISSDADKSV